MVKDNKFDWDKFDKNTVETLNKLDDLPEIVGSIYQTPPVKTPPVKRTEVKPYNSFDELVKQDEKEYLAKQKNKKKFTAKPDPSKGIIKPFENLNPKSYPVNQAEDLSMWEMMKKSARNEIKNGNYSEMQQIKDTLNDDYKRSGGQWMNDEEKKLIGKYKPKPKYNSEPMKFDINLDITQSRLQLDKRREEAERMKQDIINDRKIFEKKMRRGENSGLASIIDFKPKP